MRYLQLRLPLVAAVLVVLLMTQPVSAEFSMKSKMYMSSASDTLLTGVRASELKSTLSRERYLLRGPDRSEIVATIEVRPLEGVISAKLIDSLTQKELELQQVYSFRGKEFSVFAQKMMLQRRLADGESTMYTIKFFTGEREVLSQQFDLSSGNQQGHLQIFQALLEKELGSDGIERIFSNGMAEWMLYLRHIGDTSATYSDFEEMGALVPLLSETLLSTGRESRWIAQGWEAEFPAEDYSGSVMTTSEELAFTSNFQDVGNVDIMKDLRTTTGRSAGGTLVRQE